MPLDTRPSSIQLRPIFLAVFLSWVGNWMTSLVIFNWAFEMTRNPLWVGIGLLCHRLPLLFSSMIFAQAAAAYPARLRATLDFARAAVLAVMAAIVFRATTLPVHLRHDWVIAFLALAAVRSFLSGADGPTESSIISTEAKGNRDRAAHNQQVISQILGLSGFIASALFTLGVLSISLVGVLIVDLSTFIVSGMVFMRAMRHEQIGKMSKRDAGAFIRSFGTALKYPDVIVLTAAHCIRMVGICVALQQWILLLQLKFGMGMHSSGYLYMTYTAAWWLSAQIVRIKKWSLNATQFLALSTLVCLFSPLGWYLPSIFSLILYTFTLAFADGAMLATIGADFQRRVRERHIADVFANQILWTQVGVVGGALAVGRATETLGYRHGSLLIGAIATMGAILLWMVYAVTEPLLEWIWHRVRLWRAGYPVTQTYVQFSSVEDFLELGEGSESCKVEIVEGTSMIQAAGRTLYSGATLLAPNRRTDPRWHALSLAIFESLERVASIRYYERSKMKPPLPTTSGMAVHNTAERARKAAFRELVERDSVMAHYYYKKAGLLRIERQVLLNSFTSKAQLAASCFQECNIYRLPTHQSGLAAWVCVASVGKDFSVGWGICEQGSAYGVEKCLSEAIAAFRFHRIKKFEALKERARSGLLNPEGRDEMIEISEKLGVNFTDIQMAMILSAPGARERLSFLDASPKCSSVREALVAFEQTAHWLQPGGPIQVEDIEDNILGNLLFAKATMPNAFELQWPRQPIEQIIQIHRQRFERHGVELSDNANGPCFYY